MSNKANIDELDILVLMTEIGEELNINLIDEDSCSKSVSDLVVSDIVESIKRNLNY